VSYETSNAFAFTKDLADLCKEIDDSGDEINKLRRLVAHYRGCCKRLEINLKDLKSKSIKDMAKMKDKLKVEQKRRINV
jgi:hypothetical protein